MEHARDMREWMRAIERRLAENRRSVGQVRVSVIEQIKDELPVSDGRKPAAPVELVYETALYTEPSTNRRYGRLLVDFPDVTKATDATDITVSDYELWGRDDTNNSLEATTSAVAGLAAPGLTFPGLAATQANKDKAAKNLGSWRLLDTSGASSLRVERLVPGSVWSFRVRAINESNLMPGTWSAEFQTQVLEDITPPPQPTPPKLSASHGTIKIEWDGMAVTGAMPSDFAYLDIAHGEEAAPTRVIARFYRGGGTYVISDFAYYKPQFVRFQAVDSGGMRSPWSEQSVGYTTPLVDADVILSEIDGNETVIKNVGAEALKDGAILREKLAAGAIDLTRLDQSVQDAVAQGNTALDKLYPLELLVNDTDSRLTTAESDLSAAEGRLTTAENDLDTAFGQLGTVDSRIDTAKQATLTTAASDAQTKADNALAAANAQVAQVIARGQSLVRNGDFEAGADGWPVSSFNAVESGNSRSGTKSMRIGPNPGGNVWPTSEWTAGATGRVYYLEAWFKRTGTESVPAGVGFVVQAKTAAGGTATFTVGTVDSSTITTASFTKVTYTYTLTTADTVAVRFAPWIKAGNNTYYVDDMLVVDVTEAQNALTAANTAQTAATNAQTAAGNAQTTATNALNMATSKSKVYYSTTTPSGTGTTTGDLWRQRDGSNAIIGEWQWDAALNSGAGGWVKQTVSGSNVSNMDIGYLTAGAATMSQALIDKLVAGTANFQTVDVKNLFATSGTMNSAVITKLWADVVNSQKITTKMLAVTDPTNFAPSPAESPGDWNLTGGMTIVNNSSISVAGSRFEAVGNTSTAWAYGPQKAVTPGEKLYMAATVYRSSANDTTGAFLRFQWYDKNKATLASPQYTGTQTTGPSGTRMEMVVEVPAGAAYAILTLPIVSAGVGNETLRTSLYDVVARRQTGAVLIEDGAVTANKVAANAIFAKNIVVGDFQNIAIGSDFEDATAIPWNLHPNHSLSGLQKKFGTSSLRLVPETLGVSKASYFNGDFRVREGEQWYFSFWAYIDTAFDGDGNSKFRVASNSIGGAHLLSISYDGITRNTWTKLEGTLTVPAGTTSLAPMLWSTHGTGYAYIDDIQFRRVAEPSLIQSLGVEKLTASSATLSQAVVDKLWAEVVSAKKITTDMMVISSGTNAFADPQIKDAEGWNTPYFSATGGMSGGGSINIPMNSLQSGAYYAQGATLTNRRTRLIAGGTYRLSGWVKTSAAAPANSLQLYLRYQSDGSSSGSLASNVVSEMPWNLTPTVANTWTFISGMVKIPDNTASLGGVLGVYKQTSYTTGTTIWSDLGIQQAAAGELIVDGAITATHLGVDSVTAAAIKALTITANEIAANAVEADKIKAGAVTADKLEATLILASTIIAGLSTSTHAEMSAEGFRVFAEGDDGIPYETVRMGVADTDDLFTVTDSTGASVAQIDNAGTISGRSLEAVDSIYYKGEELSSYVGSRPRGMAAWAQVPINTSNMSVNAGMEVGLFELAWDGGDVPPRMYEFQLNTFLAYCNAAGTAGLRLRYTDDGTVPTINSQLIQYNYQMAHKAGYVGLHLNRLIGSNNGNYLRVLVCLYAADCGVTVYGGNNYLYARVMDLGESIDPTGVATTGGGTPAAGGSTVASPVVAKVTKTVEYGYTSVKSYLPDNSVYNYNTSKGYQGLSPAGYGNLRSIYGFNQNFQSLLAGATINGIWIYAYFEHWYYNAGGTAIIRLHNNLQAPGSYTGVTGSGMSSSGWPKAAGRWVAVPSSLWAGFASGAYKGFALVGDGTYQTYGYANNARIKIKYTK